MRLDKFLFVSRLFDSRSKAAAACNGGRIRLNGRPGHPDSLVVAGDTISMHRHHASLSFKVLSIPKTRVSARNNAGVLLLMDKEKPGHDDMSSLAVQALREKGTGRPTKKERRRTDNFLNHQGDFLDV